MEIEKIKLITSSKASIPLEELNYVTEHFCAFCLQKEKEIENDNPFLIANGKSIVTYGHSIWYDEMGNLHWLQGPTLPDIDGCGNVPWRVGSLYILFRPVRKKGKCENGKKRFKIRLANLKKK